MIATEIMQERVRIPGPRGALAGELSYPAGANLAACLLVNPHPLMGGRMDNNVIALLASRLPGAGIITLRFDYGGIGQSDGPPVDIASSMNQFWDTNCAPEDPVLIEEAGAARNWLAREAPLAPLILIGYSFGALAAARISQGAAGLVLISPTIGRHDLAWVAHIDTPLLVIRGNDDFAASPGEFEQWRRSLIQVARVTVLPCGNHFFRGMESKVADACCDFITETLKNLEVQRC